MKRILSLVLLLVITLGLIACEKKDDLESVGLNGLSAKEILTGLGDNTIDVDGYGVSVYPDELVVILEDERISLEMPKDEFYLSVAPYINQTHECLYHSATGCRGELKNETFYITFTTNDGEVLIDQQIDSLSNGFIDLWLPRNIEGTLTITHDGKTASKIITTDSEAPTCETTMKLL
jgi:hypothetical protein